MFQNGGEEAIDFIRKCLYYNPQKRMTIEEAILHPYLKEFQGTEEEGVKDSIVETLMDDNFKYSVKEYRDALYMHLNEKKKNDHKHLIIRNL